jgi:hypothetical protein
MTETEKAWLAGLVDGEGCIYAGLNKYGGIDGRLMVLMTYKPAIDRILEITGVGFVQKKMERKRKSNRRQAWVWTATIRLAVDILMDILPYLVVKKKQAEMYIRMMELHTEGRRRIVNRANHLERISLMQAIKADKHVEFRE